MRSNHKGDANGSDMFVDDDITWELGVMNGDVKCEWRALSSFTDSLCCGFNKSHIISFLTGSLSLYSCVCAVKMAVA